MNENELIDALSPTLAAQLATALAANEWTTVVPERLARRLLRDVVQGLNDLNALAPSTAVTELYEAANEYLGNAGRGAPTGVRADMWDRLVDAVTNFETANAKRDRRDALAR